MAFLAILRGTGISKDKAHSASVLIIVCRTIVLLFLFIIMLERRNQKRGEVKREERRELEKIDTNSQKPFSSYRLVDEIVGKFELGCSRLKNT